jgi:hypothetical protein
MNWWTRLKCMIRFSLRYDVAYPIRGRLMVLAARWLLALGVRAAEKGISMALWFESYIGGGIWKRAHQCGRSEEWSRSAAGFVDEARALKVKLHGEEPRIRPIPGTAMAGIHKRDPA